MHIVPKEGISVRLGDARAQIPDMDMKPLETWG